MSFLLTVVSFAQDEDEDVVRIISEAERPISPSYRIAEKPMIIDTVVPIPKITYPLLSRNMRTEISIEQIQPSKIRIVPKLAKLYPGYVRLGIGNYSSPLGEIYYNMGRNRRTNMGIHIKHNSSFGKIKGYAPARFDNTTAHLFGEFFTSRFKIESDLDYLNNGYNYYGIKDSTESISKDSLKNRVQGIDAAFRISNYSQRDSAKILYTIKSDFGYFHEFDPKELDQKAENTNFSIGTEMAYKLKHNIYAVDFSVRHNNYRFADQNSDVALQYWHKDNNTLINLKPHITSYGEKWKVIMGLDLNFDIEGTEIFKVIPILEGKYSLFNNMFIPYVGIGGGVKQNTFKTLNRTNEFIRSELDLKNTKEFKFYGGIKGTLSKTLSFNVQVHSTTFSDMPLFVNDTLWSNLYEFNVVYDRVTTFGITGSISYQAAEKLKVDGIVKYNNYSAENELHAWNLPTLDIRLRGNYNLFEKIYVKADLVLQGGRKSPEGLFVANPDDNKAVYELGFLADANLHGEYRYNDRVSVFIQFNNLAAQKYFRWNRYPVQGFQVLGGFTFAF